MTIYIAQCRQPFDRRTPLLERMFDGKMSDNLKKTLFFALMIRQIIGVFLLERKIYHNKEKSSYMLYE